MEHRLQEQYQRIERFFKTTAEPYDCLEWSGSELEVVLDNRTIERYTYQDLCEIIPDFAGI